MPMNLVPGTGGWGYPAGSAGRRGGVGGGVSGRGTCKWVGGAAWAGDAGGYHRHPYTRRVGTEARWVVGGAGGGRGVPPRPMPPAAVAVWGREQRGSV